MNPHFSRGLLNHEKSAGSLDLSDLLLHPGVWAEIWISGMENGMKSEYTQLQLGTVQSSLSYLMISRALTSL